MKIAAANNGQDLAEHSSLGASLRAAPAEAPAERRAWLRRETI
jgi:hypothetical protein